MKAVVAAGGFATRFLPVSKVVPKELLPVQGKPIIHYQLSMLLAAGIHEIIIVVRRGADLIHEYFEPDAALEAHLGPGRAAEMFTELDNIRRRAMIAYTHELEDWPYGDAESLLAARPWLTPGEAFYLLWADDLIISREPAPLQLEAVHDSVGVSVVAVQAQAANGPRPWGSVDLDAAGNVVSVPPRDGTMPGAFAQIGHFLFTPEVLKALDASLEEAREGHEFWIGDILRKLAQDGALRACQIEGQWLAAGDPERWLAVNARMKKCLEEKELDG